MKRYKFECFVLTFVSVIALAGCGSGGEGGTEGPMATVAFGTQIQPIFDRHCVSCHNTGAQAVANFMPLVAGRSYQNLVNQDSTRTDGGGIRVVPFESENSVLYKRVSGIGLPPTEQTMPQGGPMLSQADQNLIKTWIDEGAQDN